jgi:Rieske Fe-S protein
MCHYSTFSFTGQVTHGPAQSPLQHYALCLSNGVVAIDPNSVVPSTQRLNA